MGGEKRKVEKQKQNQNPTHGLNTKKTQGEQSSPLPLRYPVPVSNVDKNWTLYSFCNLVKCSVRTGECLHEDPL